MKRPSAAGRLDVANRELRPPSPATEVRAPAGDVSPSIVSTPSPRARRPTASISPANVSEEGAGGPPPSGTISAGAGVGAFVGARVGALVGVAVGALVSGAVGAAVGPGLVPWQLTSSTTAPLASTIRTKSLASPSRNTKLCDQTNV